MRRKYVSDDGAYISLLEDSNGYRLVWTFPDDDYGTGAFVGDSFRPEKAPPQQNDAAYETWVASDAAYPFSDKDLNDVFGFVFPNKRIAADALRNANQALLGNKPWPEWARKAKSEGWTPPDGWKP